MSKIGEAITKRGLTVYRVSKLSGIPETTIYNYVHEKRNIHNARFEIIMKLCDVLKAEVDEIM